MKVSQKVISLSCALFLFSACTTAAPKDIPAIDAKELPAIEMKSLNPKIVDLSVKNLRNINAEAHNSKEVEERLYSVISEALLKSNIKVDPLAKTKLNFEIKDYANATFKGECVQIEASCKLKKGTVSAKSFSCFQFKNAIYNYSMGGDISEAYTSSLKALITGLNEQAEKYDEWFQP